MIGTLYRYPHPQDPTRFVYVGQGPKRDWSHRSGKSSFGRRFKKLFPGVELSQPIREQIEISSQLELNEEETIWMFRYHTWCEYPDGMNLLFPGSLDYKNMGKIGSHEDKVRAGKISGRKSVENGVGIFRSGFDKSTGGRIGGPIAGRIAVESGQISRLGKEISPEDRLKWTRMAGRKAVESGHLASIRTPEHQQQAGRIGGLATNESTGGRKGNGGRVGMCIMWNIKRGKPCTCGKHLGETK